MNEKFALRALIGALDLTGVEQRNINAIGRKAGFLEIVAPKGRAPVTQASRSRGRDERSAICFAVLDSSPPRTFRIVQSTPIVTSNGELPGMTGNHAPARRKIEQHELLAERSANDPTDLVREPRRCKGCGGTNLYVTEVLDPRTGKSFEVTRCVDCNLVGWAEL